MPRITGGEAVVRSLSTYNVSTVFGIPGAHNLAIYDACLTQPISSILLHVTSKVLHSWPMVTLASAG